MHLRISALLCCAILAGFATAAQSSSDKGFYPGEIDIDDDLEGSGGGGTEVSRDLESSGSGFGPDDEDSPDTHHNVNPSNGVKVPPPTVPPKQIEPVSGSEEDRKTRPSYTGDSDVIMNPKSEDTPTSFFAQPGILAAVIGGAVVGLLCAILVVMFIVYRMRKKDEGSYPLDEPKHSPAANSYSRNHSKEFFA